MGIVAGLILSVLLPQTPPEKVTFEMKAAPLERALPELSKALHIKLRADGGIEKEVVLISVKNASVKDLLARIADVSSGIWVQQDDARVLRPDMPRWTKQKADLVKSRGEAFQKHLADLKKVLDNPNIPDVNKLPGHLASLMSQQDPAIFGKLETGERVVFTNQPTAAQLPLRGLSPELVETLVRSSFRGQDPRVQAAVPTTTPGKVFVSVLNAGPYTTPSPSLLIYDTAGKVIARGGESVGIPFTLRTSDKKVVKDDPPSKQLPTDDISAEIGMIATRGGSQTADTKLSPRALEMLAAPDQYDPLSFLPSTALIQRAKECGQQLVACLSDDMFQAETSLVSRTAGAYLQLMSGPEGPLAKQEKEGWMLLAPSEPTLCRETRMNRKVMAALVKKARSPLGASLEDMAGYAATETGASPSFLAGFFLTAFLGESTGMLFNWQPLQFYGLLPPTVQKSLRNGQKVATREFGTAAMNRLSLMANGGNFTGLRPRMQPNVPPLLTEFTEALPNGIPGDALLQLEIKKAPVVKATGGGTADEGWRIMTAGQLGEADYNFNHPTPGASPVKMERFRMGEKANLNFIFTFSPVLIMAFTLNDSLFSNEVVSRDKLPEDFLKAAVEKKGGGIFFFPGGTKTPPPS